MKKLLAIIALGLTSLVSSNALQAMTLSIDPGSFMCVNITQGFGCGDINTYITGHEGIRIGESQAATGSHSGSPDGSETPGIDNPWGFLGNTGMHLTTSPVTILSQGTNTMTLDFSGWGMTWNGVPYTPLNTGAWYVNPDGVALVTCTIDCSHGDSYELRYTATIPSGDPTNLGGVQYGLVINGTVSTVPLPAAFWLFASGLVVFLSSSRRR